MGVQTPLTLTEAQALFPSFELEALIPTQDGVVDTTYLTKNYVLKYFERDTTQELFTDTKLLELLAKRGFNTPRYLASSKGWHLYSRLQGKVPQSIAYFHIQALARFLGKFHSLKPKSGKLFLENTTLFKTLTFTQRNYFFYYKKLQSMQTFTLQNDGFIHGDIFKDNTLFDGEKIAVFDFIDGGLGAFSFDVGVTLLAFNPKKKDSLTKLFLNTYNQHAPKKLYLQEVQKELKNAAKFYALLRIEKYKNPKKAKLLSNLW